MPVRPSVRYCMVFPLFLSVDVWPGRPRRVIQSIGTMFRINTEHRSVLQEVILSGKSRNRDEALEPRGRADRPVRADAQRNEDALLEAALAVFATSGVDAPVREIAEKAGVGIGTVYRHFPQRADLVAAVFRHEIDACADAAP